MLLSILAVFITGAETQLGTKISDPSSLIQAGLIFKCIKAAMTITILSNNGVANDYFVITFFLTTSVCGLVYLSKGGYNIPPTPNADEDDDKVLVLRR